MKKLLKEKSNWIYVILLVGITIRFAFYFFGAKIYFGSENLFSGDTFAWLSCIQNLIHHGTFTSDFSYADGMYFRPPGYSFFLMPFYFLSGFNVDTTYKLAQLAQIILDGISIWLIYQVMLFYSKRLDLAILCSLLYCFYPFVIVWTPYLHAESPSIFFLLLSLYLLNQESKKYSIYLAGIALGFSILLRLQILFIIPAIAIQLLLDKNLFKWNLNNRVVIYLIIATMTYSLWPIRNLMHGKLVITEELKNNTNWSEDTYNYMLYIWSVKTDHNPQFNQIINGQNVSWPKESYLHEGDSLLLSNLAKKCYACGRGFSNWKYSAGLVKETIKENNQCTKDVSETFKRLRSEQIAKNPINFYLIVPLSNLKKAIFKDNVYAAKSPIVNLAISVLFFFRTILIAFGIIGVWLNYKYKLIPVNFCLMILLYAIFWYFTICFLFRNIEIRYLLINDVLLLIPASITTIKLLEKLGFKINLS